MIESQIHEVSCEQIQPSLNSILPRLEEVEAILESTLEKLEFAANGIANPVDASPKLPDSKSGSVSMSMIDERITRISRRVSDNSKLVIQLTGY